MPDGKEAKASPTIMSSGMGSGSGVGTGHCPPQDLYMLNQYIQEALAREQILETKLALLQRLVGQTEVASDNAWKSLIDEDRLLTRVEILESQLSAYGKSMTEDKLREETQRLIEEKEVYQEKAKNTMQNLANDKLEAVKKAKELERQLSSIEDEYTVLKDLYDKDVEENKKLATEIERLTKELEEAKKNAEEVAAKEENEVKEGQQAVENGIKSEENELKVPEESVECKGDTEKLSEAEITMETSNEADKITNELLKARQRRYGKV